MLRNSDKIINEVITGYNAIASHFSDTRQTNWPEFDLLKKYIKPGMKILDLGCGNGRLYKFFKDKGLRIDYYGLDISEEFIKICQQRFPEIKSKFKVGNILDLTFEDEYFDFIISIATFHHLPNNKTRLKSLREIKRVLKPGGLFFMTNWYIWHGPFKKYFFNQFLKKRSLNDFFIPWKNSNRQIKTHRYYHSFNLSELKRLHSQVGFNLSELKKFKPNIYKRAINIVSLAKK